MTPRRRDPSRRRRRARLQAWDRVWVRRGQKVRLPRALERLLLLYVKLGDGWGWIAVAALLALVLPPGRFAWTAGQGLFAAALSLAAYRLLKAAFRRARPYTLYKRVAARVAPRDLYSFPSGHTMNNLAIATSLAFHLPILWPVAIVVPVTVGLLRVLFGVHFVSDVAGGVAFGLLAGALAAALYPPFLAILGALPPG